MKLYDIKLLSITCEILAEKQVVEILERNNASGYTIFEARGSGSKGVRGEGFKSDKNIKIEVLLPEEKLQTITEEIARTLFSDFAIIVFVEQVKVLRPEKFF